MNTKNKKLLPLGKFFTKVLNIHLTDKLFIV